MVKTTHLNRGYYLYYDMVKTIIFIAGVSVLSILALHFYRKTTSLQEQLKEITSQLKSTHIKFGQKVEHLSPFTKSFPEGKAIFLGQPIDYMIFGEELIHFIDVKTGNAQLSNKQKKIKKQIEDGKVEFKEVRYG